jgi:hypothetical protein
MSRITLLLAALIFSVGCGYGSHSNYMNNSGGMGAPQIANLQPAMTAAGGQAFMLTVNGSGFGTDSVVYWNAVAQATTYLGPGQVTAAITAQDIMNSGMVPVYVRSGGRNSNTVNFDVQ